MLYKIKKYLGIADSSKDEALIFLISDCGDFAKQYCHIDSICGLENIICEMVVYKFNQLDNEGLNSESYSGVSFNYSQDYPERIYKALNSHRRLRTCK